MTLIELLIAMSIFLILGFALVSLMRGGLDTWRTGEQRREVLSNAATIIEQLTTDMRSMYTNAKNNPRVRFLADYDPHHGLSRIRFVRAIEGEAHDFLLRESGSLVEADKLIDEYHDRAEAFRGELLPTGGLCEVAYVLVPDNSGGAYDLYRAIRSPIGDPGRSVFLDSNVTPSAARSNMRLFAKNVLYLGMMFWTQYTTCWDPTVPTRMRLRDRNSKSGPMFYWDSTRALMQDTEGAEANEFRFFRGTPYDTSDDIFPSKVRLTLVVREEGRRAISSRLLRSIDASSTTIALEDAAAFPANEDQGNCYVFIDGEWIQYAERYGRELQDCRRGARGTRPAAHDKGARVETGRSITFVVNLPSFREAWDE